MADNTKATLSISTDEIISEIDEKLYGSFIEHLGRAVYGGIYEPGNENSDESGFRKDVLEAVKALNIPVIRYPGGNFVSGFNWEDSVGPRDNRPKKLELAWRSVETNEVGLAEFDEWTKKAGSQIMLAVNLGTRGADEARELAEYCNMETDTYFANLRRSHGHEKPYGIKFWCLGNEMDGYWQIGCKTAEEYANVAGEAAKLIRLVDENAKFIFCGSSHPYMESFGTWEKTVLSKCFDYVDYISLHFYFGNPDNRTPDYLASSIKMNRFINDVRGFIEDVKQEKKSDKEIYISFDEWNVWFHSNDHDSQEKPWQIAPRLLEDHYNFEDALVVGSLLITLINNSDIVKIACLAQLVNVIAPIMVEPEGVYLQTIYYPFMHASVYGRGTALNVNVLCDTYDTDESKEVPYLLSAAVKSESGTITAFILNRSLDCDITTQLNVPEMYALSKHIELYHDDLKAVNTLENKDCVTPREVDTDNSGFITLKKHSWNVLVYNITIKSYI